VPIYEYLCEECGRISEVIQKLSDPGPRICTECGSKKIARLVSRSAFQLKGGGWYADLYGSAKKGAKEGDAAPKAEPSTKGEGAKGEGAKSDATKVEGAKGEAAKSPAEAKPKTEPAATPKAAPAKKGGG
jgi:putative FmdB family regulatory protein